MSTMLDEFFDYAKTVFGCELSIEKGEKVDTFETFFGASFLPTVEDDMFSVEELEQGTLTSYDVHSKNEIELESNIVSIDDIIIATKIMSWAA